MKPICVIPARMGASRFPGKPLAPLIGRPMLEHVWLRARMSGALETVLIATPDKEIRRAAESWGAEVVMTSDKHERASDRVAEVAAHEAADVVLMVQGDEPMVVPEMIDLALLPMKDPKVHCVNLAAPIRTVQDFEDRNTIKIVMGREGNALYMSREPIPTRAKASWGAFPAWKQVCVIPFRRDFLLTFARLKSTPLERAESIDMLRALEHGYPVRIVPCDIPTQAVDTPDDLARVSRLMAGDPLVATYRGELVR